MGYIRMHFVLTILTILLGLAISEARFSLSTGREWCAQRAGLKESDIANFGSRNDNCSIDCTTQQATLLSFHVQNGLRCRQEENSTTTGAISRCFMGLCLRDDEVSQVDTSELYEVDIYIKSANVEDRDPAPGMGGSDTIVMLEVAKDGYPNYNDGQTICHTYIIQDNNQPRWFGGRGFLCRPMPLRRQAQLKFVVLDSDKPYVNPDLLGIASEKLGTLIDQQGSKRLTFQNVSDQYWLEVEVKATPYKAKSD